MKRFGMLCLVAVLAQASTAFAQTPLERGKYLVNSILACGNCHTPRGPNGAPLMDKELSGGMRFDFPVFDVHASNITTDKETGIGKWSDADIKKLMTSGFRPDGVQVAPIMPYGFYKGMTAKDLDAVIAYLRSLPPLKNQIPPPVYKVAVQATPYPDAQKVPTEAEMKDPLVRGRYLATIGHCMECHTPMEKGHHLFDTAFGKGGTEIPGPWGISIAANITSSKTSGLGNVDAATIKRAITQGTRTTSTSSAGPRCWKP